MEKIFGQILVEKEIISPEQLALALKRQQQEKGKYLGQILIEMGVSQEKINKALDSFNKRKPIGQILLDLGVITSKQLEEALEKQNQLKKKTLRKPLGMLLV
jgi:pimeloyl-CoA synthetase